MKYLVVLLMSMVPLIEQRGAIPVGVFAYDLNYFLVFVLSLVGSVLPAPFIYIFFEKILQWMKTQKVFNKLTRFIDKKIQKNSKKLEKYEELGLIVFIGIPLPTTGVWTGTAVAAVLGLNFKKSMICILLGATISATLITLICAFAPYLLGA